MKSEFIKLPLDYSIEKATQIYCHRLKIFGFVLLFNIGILIFLFLRKIEWISSNIVNEEYSKHLIENIESDPHTIWIILLVSITTIYFVGKINFCLNKVKNFWDKNIRNWLNLTIVSLLVFLLCLLTNDKIIFAPTEMKSINWMSIHLTPSKNNIVKKTKNFRGMAAVISGHPLSKYDIRTNAGLSESVISQLPIGSDVTIISSVQHNGTVWYEL